MTDKMTVHMARLDELWQAYQAAPAASAFADIVLALHGLGEELTRLHLLRVARICQGIEALALGYMDDQQHPSTPAQMGAFVRQLDTLRAATELFSPRAQDQRLISDQVNWAAPRRIIILGSPGDGHEEFLPLLDTIRQIGFEVEELGEVDTIAPVRRSHIAALLLPPAAAREEALLGWVQKARQLCPYTQLVLRTPSSDMEMQVALLRAGVDVLLQQDEGSEQVVRLLLELTEVHETSTYRVMVVEDSKVASTIIQRTLREQGIESEAVRNPAEVLDRLNSYQPDLVLMDMQMPKLDGIEATRVIRQQRRWRSLPIVYLSGEQHIARQIEALRLGGDQFLGKPFHPIMLAAIIKASIDRYRTAQRHTQIDGLSGLLMHDVALQRLELLMVAAGERPLSIAMLDIDHFKAINDSYGHPMGDRVIMALAWLLRGKLRSSDLIARFGGEEFLLALPGADAATAESVVDHLRERFSAHLHSKEQSLLRASFSAGIAVYRPGMKIEALLERADAALLQAKQQGRNQVVLDVSGDNPC